MKNSTSAATVLGLSRMDAVLRWRGAHEGAANDDVSTRVAHMRNFVREMQRIVTHAMIEADQVNSIARDKIVRALAALLRARTAKDVSEAQDEIRNELNIIAEAQAEAWAAVAEDLRGRPHASVFKPMLTPRDVHAEPADAATA